MQVQVARGIAHYSHLGERDRFDELLIEHVERVAANVPPAVRAVAFLHDVLEHTSTSLEDLSAQGLTQLEREALELLTRAPGEAYELYVLRIAWAPGEAGAIARKVKLADLDDHIGHAGMVHEAPPYGWARRHIAVAEERCAA
jgi:hypothetical protein